MADQGARNRELITFLRNLSGGFSSYRMFGGDAQQPGFVEATRRVATTAKPVLAAGHARVGVRGDGFFSEAVPLPDDDGYRRLALACYERRIEEIAIRGVPTSEDLIALYTVLTTEAAELDSHGGARSMLTAQGVESIRLNEAIVSPTVLPEELGGLSQERDELIFGLERMEDISRELRLDQGSTDAGGVYNLLREVVAALPPDQANDIDTYKRLREAVEQLPTKVRASLSSILIKDVGEDAVAERMIGTMTDTSLARMLVDVSREVGGDPIDLARELVVGGFRRHDLVELASTAAQTSGSGEGSPVSAEGAMGNRSVLLEAIGEITPPDLRESGDEDESSIRLEFPNTEAEFTKDALATFSDYLRVDDDAHRMGTVLQSWARATRLALSEDNADFAVQLIRVADHASEWLRRENPDRAALIADAKGTILDEGLIADLMEQGSEEETSALVAMFGDAAIDALLQRLAVEEVSARRSALISVVANLIPEHRSILAPWMDDPRWFVVRNVLTIVQRAALSGLMLGLIEKAMRHPHPAVRKEAARALGPTGVEALPRLKSLSFDPDREVALTAVDVLGWVALVAAKGGATTLGEVVKGAHDDEVRARALTLLNEHPADEATEVLASIARFGSKPRAPFSIRRKARALARRRRRPSSDR